MHYEVALSGGVDGRKTKTYGPHHGTTQTSLTRSIDCNERETSDKFQMLKNVIERSLHFDRPNGEVSHISYDYHNISIAREQGRVNTGKCYESCEDF